MSVSSKVVRMFSRSYSAAAHSGPAAEEAAKLWKRLSLFVGGPAILLGFLNVYLHEKDAHEERPEFVPYEYLRLRTKRFPWGDGNHSFFHNPHHNPLPDGYEE